MKQRDLIRKLEEAGFELSDMVEIMMSTEEEKTKNRSRGTKK